MQLNKNMHKISHNMDFNVQNIQKLLKKMQKMQKCNIYIIYMQ